MGSSPIASTAGQLEEPAIPTESHLREGHEAGTIPRRVGVAVIHRTRPVERQAAPEGQDVQTVANRLGKADPALTLPVYSHVIEDREREALATLGQLLAPKIPAQRLDLRPEMTDPALPASFLSANWLRWWSSAKCTHCRISATNHGKYSAPG